MAMFNCPYLVPGLTKSAESYQLISQAIPPSRYDEKYDPERFTLREAIAHVLDWEPIMRGRIKQTLEQPGTVLEAFDEGQRAIDRNYATWDPVATANSLVAERAKTIELIQSIPADKWLNAATHPERGRLTVLDLTVMLLGHDLYHIEQISHYLKN